MKLFAIVINTFFKQQIKVFVVKQNVKQGMAMYNICGNME